MASDAHEWMQGPWRLGATGETVLSAAAADDSARVCDIRGWGFLTGKGHGALGLSANQAIDIQLATGHLIVAAPDLFDAVDQAEACMSIVEPRSDKAEYLRILSVLRAAKAKALGKEPSR